MKKILLASGLILASFGTFAVASAQSVGSAPASPVSVVQVSLDKASYQAGDTVHGTAVLKNQGAETASDIYYRVSLNGDYQNELPAVTYDQGTMQGPLAFAPHEQKTVSFDYVLPVAFHGDLGIQVRTYLRGMYTLGWDDAMIKVSGAAASAAVSQAAIVVDGTSFGLQEGPSVAKDGSAALTAKLSNNNKTELDIVPNVRIYDRTPVGDPVDAFSAKAVAIKAGQSLNISIPLPTFDFAKPGVYAGIVDFPDAKGAPLAPSLSFRYIISGDIATLYSLSADRNFLSSGDSALAMTVTYSGAPFDIVTENVADLSGTRLQINVYNEKNAVVASYDQPFDFNDGSEKTVSLAVTGSAESLHAQASAVKDGKVLSSISSALYSDSLPDSSSARRQMLIDILVAVVPLILAGIIVFAERKELKGRSFKAISMAGILIIGGACAAGVMTAKAAATPPPPSTFQVSTSGDEAICNKKNVGSVPCPQRMIKKVAEYDFSPYVTIVTPVGELSPGQTFYIKGSVVAKACSNSNQKEFYKMTYQGQTYTFTDKLRGSAGGASIVTSNGDFSFGPFTAPAGGGTYSFDLQVDNYFTHERVAGDQETLEADTSYLYHGYVTGTQQFGVSGVTAESPYGIFDPITRNAAGTCMAVSGWACDVSGANPGTHYQVVVRDENGADIGGLPVADQGDPNESALVARCGSYDHRFSIPVPNSYNDGGTHTFTASLIDYGIATPLANGVQAVQCNPPPSCPAGQYFDAGTGQCVQVVNLCPNLTAITGQTYPTIPGGYWKDASGNCASCPAANDPDNIPANYPAQCLGGGGSGGGSNPDFCTNLSGYQTQVPTNYYQSAPGICTRQVACTAADVCDWGSCDASGNRHRTSCVAVLPGRCLPGANLTALATAAGTQVQSCRAGVLQGGDITFGSRLRGGACELSWDVNTYQGTSGGTSCTISTVSGTGFRMAAFDPMVVRNVKIPNAADGSQYKLSCTTDLNPNPVEKVTQCRQEASPGFQEF